MEKRIKEIIDWLIEYKNKTNTDGFILGLSGGIDSALAAALCEKAAPEKTLGVIMPCHSDAQDAKDAYLVAEALGIKAFELNLDDVYDLLLGKLQDYEIKSDRMAMANIKPRLRMTSLYYYANLYNRLVVGTGNRDERYIGYFTKWGDGAADIMPLANLSKAEVYEMSEFLGVPKKIIDKAPSAGLWEDQTDEKEMGFTYQQLDDFINGKDIPENISNRINVLHNTSRHKFSMPPTIKDE